MDAYGGACEHLGRLSGSRGFFRIGEKAYHRLEAWFGLSALAHRRSRKLPDAGPRSGAGPMGVADQGTWAMTVASGCKS